MFKWLADMLVKTPVQGSCSCCEGKKQRLQKMQEAIINAESDDETQFVDESVISNEMSETQYSNKILGSTFYGGCSVDVGNNVCEKAEEACDCGHCCCKK